MNIVPQSILRQLFSNLISPTSHTLQNSIQIQRAYDQLLRILLAFIINCIALRNDK
jgi:hypothetical protein